MLLQAPPYTVRVSPKAQRVSLRMSLRGAVEVVVPHGFDLRHVPQLINERHAWITRTRARLLALPHDAVDAPANEPPQSLALRALEQHWQINYVAARTRRAVEFMETPGPRLALLHRDAATLQTGWRDALRGWLAGKAAAHLSAQLASVSNDTGLRYSALQVRNQKTRWGSCTRAGSISLNLKLLFLPPSLVRYVLVHELCHTRYMSHGVRFWGLVERHEPDYRRHETELRRAGPLVPQWLECV